MTNKNYLCEVTITESQQRVKSNKFFPTKVFAFPILTVFYESFLLYTIPYTACGQKTWYEEAVKKENNNSCAAI